MGEFSFPKQERLKSVKRIDQLFNEGSSVYKFPIKLVYLLKQKEEIADRPNIQASFSVPKRLHRKAVLRNRYKRQIREAYRLCRNQHIPKLIENDVFLDVMFIYTSKKEESYQDIADGLETALLRMIDKILKSE